MAGQRLPIEARDQLDQARDYYQQPLRDQNRQLIDENLMLKRLLRENSIAWSPHVSNHGARSTSKAVKRNCTAQSTRRTRSSVSAPVKHRMPHLPVEVQLRILQFALTSEEPIIDPLVKLTPENLTTAEKQRGNQIAIGFLATCKAFNDEGTRFLWTRNTFVFTALSALRNFCTVPLKYRQKMDSVTLRVIARYYDIPGQKRKLPRNYHHSLKKDVSLTIHRREPEGLLDEREFRSYSWFQLVDFLNAMRPPYDPHLSTRQNRPYLFPNLKSMRIDLVNFFDGVESVHRPEIHEMAAHHHAGTLQELIVTGIPSEQSRVMDDFEVMVMDDGLFLNGCAAFLQAKKQLRPLPNYCGYSPKVVRSWRKLCRDFHTSQHPELTLDNHTHHFDSCPHQWMPVCPEESDHPTSKYKHRRTVWKKVLLWEDDPQREWLEFDRVTGDPVEDVVYELTDDDSSDLEDEECYKCMTLHTTAGEIIDEGGW